MGAIGSQVAKIAQVFGAQVIYCSTSNLKRSDEFELVSLEQLLKQSDIVSIHAPLTTKTEGLFNAKNLGNMKKNAVLINVGRGGIVVEKDLIDALNQGIIAGACLDVFEKEPFDYHNTFKSLKDPNKLLLSPHLAWASVEARHKLVDITYQNLKDWINN
jgi:lactate dehydrogenase-like 2-hydroxyacid dehydrogenase